MGAYKAAEWFEENVNHFGNWWTIQSDVFWVNGFGKLQSKLSSRDAQVIRAGIGDLVNDKKVPTRSLRNSDGSSYFYNSSSRLGQDFYLGYLGRMGLVAGLFDRAFWKTYVEQKQQRCKTYATSGQCKTELVLNNVARF